MTHELDQILISYKQPDFQERLFSFFFSKAGLSHFGFGERHIENNRKVVDIISEVVKNKDKAVAEFTEKFDSVKLMPDEFGISQKDLQKAHKEIDPELLASLRQAIENKEISNRNLHRK